MAKTNKETWKLINEVINKSKRKTPLSPTFNYGNKILTDPLEIANSFCEYFTNVGGPNLAKKIPDVNTPFSTFLSNHIKDSIFLNPTNVTELTNICHSLKSGKTAGFDNIAMNAIILSFEFIVYPLVQIINRSISNGVFPDKLKIAKVTPVFKTDNPEYFINYRPISLLTNFSKFYEKVMHNRITNFVNGFEILYHLQFGFCKNHSTVTSLIHLINKIATSIDEKKITVRVFLDLSKAFDTLDHQTLFTKLEHYGIRGMALQWIKSYFYDCRQYVQFNEISSTENNIICGVPQGSILGPLFFLLYINDLLNATGLAECLLFSDNTSIFLSHTDQEYLTTSLNEELKKLNIWMKTNKLSVNINKTNYVIFNSKQKTTKINLPVLFDDKPLKNYCQSILGSV